MNIKLGTLVREIVTGFEGIATGRVEYITGCNQVLVAPRVKDDGAFIDSQWFDEQRLEVIKKEVVKLDNSTAKGSGEPAPRR